MNKNVLNKFIPVSVKCTICNSGFMTIINNNSLINPLLTKCTSYKCSRIKYLRGGNIFAINNKASLSVLYTILKLWLIDENNISKILLLFNVESFLKLLKIFFVDFCLCEICPFVFFYIFFPKSK